MSADPVLSTYIEPPGAFWRRRLLVVLPLVLWVAVAVPTVLASVGVFGTSPGLDLLLGLVCTGVVLVLAYIPVVVRAIAELRDALAARRTNQRVVELLAAGAAAEAEPLLRRVLSRTSLPANVLPGLVHNLGVARLERGDLTGARALMDHARASGWFAHWTFRRQRAGFAQGRILAAAVMGDLAVAEAELDDLEGAPTPAAHRPYVELARAVTQARAGRHEEALRSLSLLQDTAVPDSLARILSVLAAWLQVQRGVPPEAATEGLTPLEPGEPTWASSWPELEAFVLAHGLRRREDVDPGGPGA